VTLPLTKTLADTDFAHLPKELAQVDEYFTGAPGAREQHPLRRWEYALALDAYYRWQTEVGLYGALVYDVGGAGSPFHLLVNARIVDPTVTEAEGPHHLPYTLERFVTAGTELAHCVFCLSVLEHVSDLDRFLYHLSCLVAPRGLLFLTMDCCDGDGPAPGDWPTDTYHFHWMRKRIFNRLWWQYTRATLNRQQFQSLGECDWDYHGAHVYDYSFASLCLVKRP